MEKHLLSKSTFIRSVQCLKSLYLHKNRPYLRDRLSAEQLAKFKRGTDVGVLAQQLFPGGINLQPKAPSQYRKAIKATSEILNSSDEICIYEASFQSDQILVILDILDKKADQVFAYEVKSSLEISQTYLTDAALQYYVITNTGLKIDDFFIIYVNENYPIERNENGEYKLENIDINQFFVIKSVLDEIKEMQAFIRAHIPKAKEALFLKKSPEIEIGDHCRSPYPCDFIGHCWKNQANNAPE